MTKIDGIESYQNLLKLINHFATLKFYLNLKNSIAINLNPLRDYGDSPMIVS